MVYFNSHAHVERDYPVTKRGFTSVYFNSHAHVERDEVTFTIAPLTLYFNSHAHVERDSADTSSLYTGFISTHTLTWSVTTSNNEIPNDYANFNSHAHVERDYNQCHKASCPCHFNSHAHVERDLSV